jgi:antitoxin MazE
MNLRIKKWGNSLALRIPKKLAELSHISEDSKVEVEIRDRQLILKPIVNKKETLEDLLSRVTPENLHEMISYGGPAGKEIW